MKWTNAAVKGAYAKLAADAEAKVVAKANRPPSLGQRIYDAIDQAVATVIMLLIVGGIGGLCGWWGWEAAALVRDLWHGDATWVLLFPLCVVGSVE